MSARRWLIGVVVVGIAAFAPLVFAEGGQASSGAVGVKKSGDTMTGPLTLTRSSDVTPMQCFRGNAGTSTYWWDRSGHQLRLRGSLTNTPCGGSPFGDPIMSIDPFAATDFIGFAPNAVVAAQELRTRGYTTAGLPTCNAGRAGSYTYATDVAKGVYCNGTQWVTPLNNVFNDLSIAGYCDACVDGAYFGYARTMQRGTDPGGTLSTCTISAATQTIGTGTLTVELYDSTGPTLMGSLALTATGLATTTLTNQTINSAKAYAIKRNGGAGAWKTMVNVRCD